MRYAEAFEISEYGAPPTDADRQALFPFSRVTGAGAQGLIPLAGEHPAEECSGRILLLEERGGEAAWLEPAWAAA